MSISAADPSFLDMRNAILQADLVGYSGGHTTPLWRIFAKRGMGFYAGSIDSADTDVAQDFHVPPNPKTHNYSQYIQGTVTESVTGDPVAGANVYVAGLGNQLSAVTRADGTYAIGVPWGMYPGTYPKVVATGPGYLTASQEVTVPVGDHATADFSIQRDWADDQWRRADHRLQRSGPHRERMRSGPCDRRQPRHRVGQHRRRRRR